MDLRPIAAWIILLLCSLLHHGVNAKYGINLHWLTATYNFNIDPKSVTISGFSSGGAFAHQFHVIHSSLVNGVGVFGGAPYRCFAGSIWVSLCRLLPFLTAVERVQRQAVRDAEMGRIDDLRGLADDKVFIFHGKKDLVIRPGNGRNVEKFYNTFTADRSNIKAVYDDKAAHVFPTKYRGNADCGMLFFPGLFLGEAFVRGCDYDAVYEMFRHFYGPPAMVHRRDANRGKLIKFDQKSLFPKYSSMDKTGFAYIPSRCAFGFQCKLHIALHGCFGGRAFEDTIFPTRTEFARWANEFGVIVIFPQVAPHLIPPNLFGCWDVSGYTGIREYATRHAKQVMGIKNIIDVFVHGKGKKFPWKNKKKKKKKPKFIKRLSSALQRFKLRRRKNRRKNRRLIGRRKKRLRLS